MRSAALCIAVVASLVPSIGVAQVLADIDTIVSSLVGEAPTTVLFVGIAENTGFVDASVTITASGAVPGTHSTSTTTHPKDAPDNPLFDIIVGTDGPVNCDITAVGDATLESCNFGLGDTQISEVSLSSSSATTDATTSVTFGNITTVAAGAVNDVSLDLNLNMQGGSNGFGGAASGDTNLESTSIVMGSSASAVGMTLSVNEANVDGSVTVVMSTSQGETGGINTTSVGSINDSTVKVYMGDASTH